MGKINSEELSAQPQRDTDVGTVLLSWDSWDYPPIERSARWYVLTSLFGIGCLLYALFSGNYFFAVIIVMFAGMLMLQDIRKPTRVQTYITTSGVVYVREFFPYSEINDFSVIYQPPAIKNLSLTFTRTLSPPVTIPLDDADPNLVRAALLPYISENLGRSEESLTDSLRRVYKL